MRSDPKYWTYTTRIPTLDALRGLGLICLTPYFIHLYGLVSNQPVRTTGILLSGADGVIWIAMQIFLGETGFVLLCMAFGAAFSASLMAKPNKRKWMHRQTRRMVFFMCLSMALYMLFGAGQLFFVLALIGLVLIETKSWKIETYYLVAALCIGGQAIIMMMLAHYAEPNQWEVIYRFAERYARLPAYDNSQSILAALSSLPGQLYFRLSPMQMAIEALYVSQKFLQGLGISLVSILLFEKRILHAEGRASRYSLFLSLGAFVGLPLCLVALLNSISTVWDPLYALGPAGQIWFSGAVVIGAAYAAGIMLVFKFARAKRLRRALASVGQLTLTWSVLGTFALAWIYFSYGQGLAGSIGRVEVMKYTGVFWVIMLVISPVWTRYFYYGPMEWLWRDLVYGQRLPLARTDRIFAF